MLNTAKNDEADVWSVSPCWSENELKKEWTFCSDEELSLETLAIKISSQCLNTHITFQLIQSIVLLTRYADADQH